MPIASVYANSTAPVQEPAVSSGGLTPARISNIGAELSRAADRLSVCLGETAPDPILHLTKRQSPAIAEFKRLQTICQKLQLASRILREACDSMKEGETL